MAKLPMPFSNPATYPGHSGVDYAQPRGAVIRASGPFTVKTLSRNARGGFFIWVQYHGGPLVGYHHMDSHSGCPPVGSSGGEGDRLGFVGNTGNSTGPHLHSEVAGHATTSGYWQFFDRSRVVGAGSTAGGSGMLVVDGDWGAATTSKLQSVLGVTVDGQLGPQTISVLQGRIGAGIDGQMGPQTIAALQRVVGAVADGILGPNTVKALQTYLNNGGTFGATTPPPAPSGALVVDGSWGPATTTAFQKSLGVTADGELGPITWKAFQTAVGITADGIPGPQTHKALQMNVGATVDGALGPDTVKKLQEHLNAGKGWTKVTLPTEPVGAPAEPRTPVYPDAIRGWTVPLSSDREAGSVINRFIIHHTTNTGDEELYFKTKNDRSSCPTWYVKANGEVIEMIAPEKRPSATGSANTYSVAIETQNTSGSPAWGISEESHETIAHIAAWLSKQTKFGAFTVDFTLDRTHIIGHNEAGVNATACPGPSMNLDKIVARAKEIASVPDVELVTLTRAKLDRLKLLVAEASEILGRAS
jgi:peptidoglycan hydrolase-like protein with peptidoglycan-binding domain